MTAIIVALLAVSGAMAIAAQASRQDKYTLTGPNGVAFSDFRGYETWPAVAVSSVESEAGVMGRGMKLIVANPTMIDAYKAFPAMASLFPTAPRS